MIMSEFNKLNLFDLDRALSGEAVIRCNCTTVTGSMFEKSIEVALVKGPINKSVLVVHWESNNDVSVYRLYCNEPTPYIRMVPKQPTRKKAWILGDVNDRSGAPRIEVTLEQLPNGNYKIVNEDN